MPRSRYRFGDTHYPLRRGYVDDPLHWRYSSARNYASQTGLLDMCVDWR
jgi:putative transposase